VRIATRSDVPRDKGDRAEVDAGTEFVIDSLVSRSTLSACSFLFWVVAGIPVDRDRTCFAVIAEKSGKMVERGKAADA